MSLLSPTLYRKYVWPVDAKLSAMFPCVAFHMHGSALWALDDVIRLPDVDIVELNLEAAMCDIEANTAMEIAVVGPETKCQLEPNRAATIAGTIAA